MHVKYKLIIDNPNVTLEEISDNCLAALGHSPTFNLKADNEDDVVHGSVTIEDYVDYVDVFIEIYEKDESPNEEHKSTLKRPANMPTKANLKASLATLGTIEDDGEA